MFSQELVIAYCLNNNNYQVSSLASCLEEGDQLVLSWA